MNTKGSVEIDRPIEHVFRLTNQNVTEWSTIVLEEHIINETADVVGTTMRTITEDHGRRMEFEGVVTHYDCPHASSIELTGEMFDLKVDYTFDDLGNGTRVTQESFVSPKGLMMNIMFRAMGWLMKSANCKALDKELQSLKTFCESQKVIDGCE